MIRRTLSLVAAAIALSGLQAQAAEVVLPNSHYFQDWVFTTMTPPPTWGLPVAVGTPNTDISLAGRTLTVINVGPQNPGDEFNVFGSGQISWGPAASLPADIDRPVPTPAMVDINRGEGTLMFETPLPAGSALFVTDIDAREYFDLRFVDCASNPVDAGDFTVLQISLNTSPYPANNLPDFISQGTAPNRYWRVADPIATGGSSNQSTNGIIINSDSVCGVHVAGNRARGNGGGAQFSFGMRVGSVLNATKSVARINGREVHAAAVTRPGDVVEYDITLTNPEAVALTLSAGSITETVPANTTLDDGLDFSCASSAAGSTCSNSNPVTVPAAGSLTLSMRVQVDYFDPAAVPTIVNTVAVSGMNCAAAGNLCTVSTPTVAPAVAPVPTLSQLALTVLGLMLAGLGWRYRGGSGRS